MGNWTELTFQKYQGLGNDFVLLGVRDFKITDPGRLSRLLCRRRFGVGADGLILVLPDRVCAARMEFYNPDGSRAEMCGNGLRCVARYLRRAGWERRLRFPIMTDAGPRELRFLQEGVVATLGEPRFSPDEIPAHLEEDQVLHANLNVPDLPAATCLSIGNPHCVFFVKNVASFPVRDVGPVVERLPVFPERINVEFAELTGPGRLTCRVWERGAGETQACGTGAAAAVIAATLQDFVPGEAIVNLPGGELAVFWRERKAVSIAGQAEEVFAGTMMVPGNLVVQSSPAQPSPRHAV